MAELDALNEAGSPESSPGFRCGEKTTEKQPFGADSPSDLAELGIDRASRSTSPVAALSQSPTGCAAAHLDPANAAQNGV